VGLTALSAYISIFPLNRASKTYSLVSSQFVNEYYVLEDIIIHVCMKVESIVSS